MSLNISGQLSRVMNSAQKKVKKRCQGGMGGTGIVPAVRAGGPPAVTLYTCKNSCGRLPPTMLKPKP